MPLEQRARRHGPYEDWILGAGCPVIRDDSGGPQEIVVTGPSFGAYHAANFALKRADLFPLAICQSGVYDVSVVGWGERGDAVYFNNPADYVPHLRGDHLDWLRGQVNLLLIAGQGQWEDTTGALESTQALLRRCWPRRAFATSSTSGATTSRTTGPRGARSSRTICRGSSEESTMSTRTHLIGLLLGTEEDWPAAFEHLLEPRRAD